MPFHFSCSYHVCFTSPFQSRNHVESIPSLFILFLSQRFLIQRRAEQFLSVVLKVHRLCGAALLLLEFAVCNTDFLRPDIRVICQIRDL